MIIASNEDLFTEPCEHSLLSPGSPTEYFHVRGKRSEVTIFLLKVRNYVSNHFKMLPNLINFPLHLNSTVV